MFTYKLINFYQTEKYRRRLYDWEINKYIRYVRSKYKLPLTFVLYTIPDDEFFASTGNTKLRHDFPLISGTPKIDYILLIITKTQRKQFQTSAVNVITE